MDFVGLSIIYDIQKGEKAPSEMIAAINKFLFIAKCHFSFYRKH